MIRTAKSKPIVPSHSISIRDKDGKALDGAKIYRLNVPGLAILMRDLLRREASTFQVDREASSIQASRFLLGRSRVMIPLLASSAVGLCARRLV